MNTSQWVTLTAVISLLSAYSGFKLAHYLSQENNSPASLSKHATVPHSSTLPTEIKSTGAPPSQGVNKNVLSHPYKPHLRSANAKEENKTRASKHHNAASLAEKLKQQQDDINRFRQFLGNTKENALPVVNHRYELERLDPEWAIDKEDKLLALFEHEAHLSQFSPTALSCKSKNCRVILAVEELAQGQALYQRFKAASAKEGLLNESQTISFFNSGSTGEVYFFISQNSAKDLLSSAEFNSAL